MMFRLILIIIAAFGIAIIYDCEKKEIKMERNDTVSKLAKVFHDNSIDCGKDCKGCWCGDKNIADKLIPNFKFNIDDIIVDKNYGRKLVVIDIRYSFKVNDYLYHLDDRENGVDFDIRWETVEKFYKKEDRNEKIKTK